MYALSEVNLIQRPTFDDADAPKPLLKSKTVLLLVIGELAWDYTGTVIDLAAQMKIKETRRVSRSIAEVRRDYDRFLFRSLDSAEQKRLRELAMQYEEVCQNHLTKLSYSLSNEESIRQCRESQRYLVVAVQMAMTVIDAMRLYVDDFDNFLHSHGLRGGSMSMGQFEKLFALVPLYAGDAYMPNLPSRKLTAKILFNELKQYEHNGTEPDGADGD